MTPPIKAIMSILNCDTSDNVCLDLQNCRYSIHHETIANV